MHSILSSIFKAISIREALIKATRGTGLIPYLSKYVSRGALDQIYKLYVPPHLYYDDIIYHKYGPEFNPINPGLLALELTLGEVFSTPPPP